MFVQDCFSDLQDIKEFSKNTQYPVRDFLVSEHSAQSASQKALSCKSDFAEPLTWFSFYIWKNSKCCFHVSTTRSYLVNKNMDKKQKQNHKLITSAT